MPLKLEFQIKKIFNKKHMVVPWLLALWFVK